MRCHRQPIQLFFAALAGADTRASGRRRLNAKSDTPSFASVDAARFAAVGPHHVELIARRRRSPALRGSRGRRRSCRRAPSAATVSFFSFVNVICLRRRHALLQRHEVDVGLPLRFLPVGRRQRVEQPLAVGARRRRADLPHLLHVEERHRPRPGVCARSDGWTPVAEAITASMAIAASRDVMDVAEADIETSRESWRAIIPPHPCAGSRLHSARCTRRRSRRPHQRPGVAPRS